MREKEEGKKLTVVMSMRKDHMTWGGCGRHVSEVMDKIPHDEWCTCQPKYEKDEEGGKKEFYPPKESAPTTAMEPTTKIMM
ncbi:hypothetical protein V8F06_011073 [Rhypophila decipiens]